MWKLWREQRTTRRRKRSKVAIHRTASEKETNFILKTMFNLFSGEEKQVQDGEADEQQEEELESHEEEEETAELEDDEVERRSEVLNQETESMKTQNKRQIIHKYSNQSRNIKLWIADISLNGGQRSACMCCVCVGGARLPSRPGELHHSG